MVVGCGAGCSCHRVGQILGCSIWLGVIHHLRTTHGSRGSGGPRAAAAALRARATGAAAAAAAAAASVSAPAATAAKAGSRRPRAPRAREGLAISGGPCASTFIFSPSGCPLARAHIAAWGHSGPRGEGMAVPGSGGGRGTHGSASRSRSPGPGQAALGSGALVCIHTIHALGSSYHQRCRLGDDPEAGAEGGVDPGGSEHFAFPGLEAESCEVPPTPSAAGGSPSRGTPGRAGCGLERSLKPSPPPSLGTVVGGEWYARGSAPSELSGFPPCLSHLATKARLPNPRELSQGTLTRRRRKAECTER